MRNDTKTVSDSHEIDDAAITLVRSYLPRRDWIVREDKPDYHIDFNVELVENGEPSGQRLLLQVKGKKAVKFTSGSCSFSLKKKDLDYYVNRCVLPVFLVIVDTKRQLCYYTFVQQWVDDNKPPEVWGTKKKLSVKVKNENSFSNLADFRGAAQKSLQYMREKYPSSIESSVKGEIAKLKEKDPEFDYILDFSHNGTVKHVTLLPANRVARNLNMTIKGEDSIQKISDHFDYGLKLELPLEDVTIKGSPIFEEQRFHVGKFETKGTVRKAEMLFVSKDPVHPLSIQLNGEVTVGRKGFHYSGTFNGIINFDAKFQLMPSLKKTSHEFSFTMEYDSWIGKNVTILSYFEQIKSFIEILSRGIIVDTELHIEGNRLISGTINANENPHSSTTQNYNEWLLSLISDIRFVAKKLNINPIWFGQEKLTDQEIQDWQYAADLLRGKEVTSLGDGEIINFTITLNESYRGDLYSGKTISGAAKFYGAFEFKSLGCNVLVSPVEYVIVPSRLEIDEQERAKLKQPNATVAMRCVGIADSKLHLSLASEPDAQPTIDLV